MLPVLGMPLFYLGSYYPYQRNKNIAVIFSAQPLQQRISVLAYTSASAKSCSEVNPRKQRNAVQGKCRASAKSSSVKKNSLS